MSVNGVGVNPNVNYPQTEQKQKGGAFKAVASTFIPGLGQFCDGRGKAGALFLGGTVAASLGSRALAISSLNSMAPVEKAGEVILKSSGKAKYFGALALGLAATGLWIANIVDAYKGGNQAQNVKTVDASSTEKLNTVV